MMNKPRVLLVGPVYNLSGYSEHARTLLDSLIEMEDTIDLYVQDTQWAASTRSSKYLEKYQRLMNKTAQVFDTRRDAEGRINIAGLFDCTYQVRPPNEFQQMSENDIGVTAALETTFAPPEWVSKCNMMKQILVVSEHAKKNLKNTKDDNGTGISIPITVIPFGYDDTAITTDIYRDLGITTNFNFLSVFQMAPRKNFENMLRWFVEEFKNDADVGLVIKSHMQNNSTLDFHGTKNRINAILDSVSKERQCKVYFMHGSFTEQEMLSLYNPKYIDCYITATHGEGFGIPLFNAACNKIPVIATNWSGHLDFLRAPSINRAGKTKFKSHFLKTEYDLGPINQQHIMPGLISEGCIWAYPKEKSFRKNLRFIYKNKSSLTEDVKNLQSHLRDKMSLSNIKQKYKDFTSDHLSLEVGNNVEIGDIPKISVITSIYNGDEFIRKFLEDITNQTIFENKCELILINANSPGNEEGVINEYLEKYPNNIIYKKLDQDPGIYGVWNIGVEMSTGEFLTNANLDDRKRADSLEIHAKELYSNPDVDLVYANSFCTFVPNETFNDSNKDWDLFKAPVYNGKDTMIKGNPPHQNPMWRKALHEKHGMFNGEYFSAGDWEMWLRASFGGSKFKHINKVLGLYYFNPEGISTNKETESKKQREEMSIFMKYNKLLNTEG